MVSLFIFIEFKHLVNKDLIPLLFFKSVSILGSNLFHSLTLRVEGNFVDQVSALVGFLEDTCLGSFDTFNDLGLSFKLGSNI